MFKVKFVGMQTQTGVVNEQDAKIVWLGTTNNAFIYQDKRRKQVL